MQDTKRRILDTALDQFSKKGFSAVSIRDLCGTVGIKESSIYYHFKNKQAIFGELFHEFETISGLMRDQFDAKTAVITSVDERPFVTVGLVFLNNCLLDEKILKFIRMLSIEQHVNAEAARLYRQILFDAPITQNKEALKKLMQAGCFREGDVRLMAEEYYAPILYVFLRYFSSGEATQGMRERANERLSEHLQAFYRKYSIRSGESNDENL